MCVQASKALASLGRYAGLSEPLLFAYMISIKISRTDSYIVRLSFTDVDEPLSCVYGVPVATAMRLVKTLAQAGRNMAAILVSFYSSFIIACLVCGLMSQSTSMVMLSSA